MQYKMTSEYRKSYDGGSGFWWEITGPAWSIDSTIDTMLLLITAALY